MLPLNKNLSKRNIFLGLILGLFLALIIFSSSAKKIVVGSVVAVSRPFLKMNDSLGDWWGRNAAIFKNKKELQEENLKIKEKIVELESKLLSLAPLEKENEELKTLLSYPTDAKKYILAAVISRPPQSPYDVFIIDAGSDNGVTAGMRVTVFSNILLGYVTDIFSKTSKVKLISFPGEETNALIESVSTGAKISAAAIGRGGGDMEIKMPSSIEIHSGDRIMTPGTYPLVLGIVERAEINLSDPFQKILFRLPVNPQELKYVMIEK